MSSTLCIRKTPKPDKNQWHFKLPIKSFIAKRYYDHDGSCGGSMITIHPSELPWFEGILEAGNFDAKDRKDFEKVVQVLRDGDTIDLWFEV